MKLPLVVTEHYSGLLLGTATEREYWRVKETIEKSDSFIFVGSNFQKTICGKLGIEKDTCVIPNMVEGSLFKEDVKNEKQQTKFTFLVACHMKKHKSVNLVIQAFHEAFAKDDNIRLVVAGEGEELQAHRKLVVELGEESRIQFYGKYSREESKAIFSSANAFVLTSQVEPFGIVYIEAMASGLPCIGTKGQGADDIIDETNGLLVPHGDVEELAIAMKKLYENKEMYDSEMIRECCAKKFSENTICQMLEKVYLGKR